MADVDLGDVWSILLGHCATDALGNYTVPGLALVATYRTMGKDVALVDRPLQAIALLLQVTEAVTAMAVDAMVVVRATVGVAVAAAVEAKEATTLAVARAVLSVVGEAGMASS